MSKIRNLYAMPPGLKTQIAFAIILTLGALLVLPSALSASQPIAAATAEADIGLVESTSRSAVPPATVPPATLATAALSAGHVRTTIIEWPGRDLKASAFADWD